MRQEFYFHFISNNYSRSWFKLKPTLEKDSLNYDTGTYLKKNGEFIFYLLFVCLVL